MFKVFGDIIDRPDNHPKKGRPDVEFLFFQKIIEQPGYAKIAYQHPKDQEGEELAVDIAIKTFEPSIDQELEGLKIYFLEGIDKFLVEPSHKGHYTARHSRYFVGCTHDKTLQE